MNINVLNLKLIPVQEERFDDFDKNGDGFIDASEISLYPMPYIVAESYVKAYDKNRDDKLDRKGTNAKLFKLLFLMNQVQKLLSFPN